MVTDTFFSREPVIVASDFVGRKEAIAWVTAKLGARSPQNVNIIGEPKIGKSSLLRYIVSRQVGAVPQVQTVYVWLDLLTLPVCDSAHFWPFLLKQLQTAVSQASLTLPKADEDLPPLEQIADLLGALPRAERPLRLILVIDAFERLSPELSDRDLNWLRSLLTAHGEWLAFVISSPKPIGQLLAQREQTMIGSLFSEYFKDYYLVLLGDDESIAFCRHASAAFADGLSQQDVDFLLAEAGPHPALLKMACEYLLQAMARASSRPYEDVAADLRLDSGVQSLCKKLWLARSPEEQAMLFALARGQEAGDRQLLVRKLGLAVQRNGRLQLFSRVFADFVRQQPDIVNGETAVSSFLNGKSTIIHLPESRIVKKQGQEIVLTKLENRLLTYLRNHAGHVCTYEELRRSVWKPESKLHVVEKGVNRLRAKIEDDPDRPRYIISMRGEGYLWQE
ncbi:MAG: hypothetical protein Kow0080_33930 [Candidatus Promineifilaceae bacterium]